MAINRLLSLLMFECNRRYRPPSPNLPLGDVSANDDRESFFTQSTNCPTAAVYGASFYLKLLYVNVRFPLSDQFF
jgi:hypothetical protein